MSMVKRALIRWIQVTLVCTPALACVATAVPVTANSPASADAATAEAPGGASVLDKTAAKSDSSSTDDHGGHDHAQASTGDGEAHEHEHNHVAPGTEQGDPHATMYTCPMHLEIRQQGPGRCPKCGMHLEPEKPENK